MDTSGLSGLGGAAAAMRYAVGVEKLALDQKKQEGAAIVRLIEGAAAVAPAPERLDGKGALVDVVA